MTTLIANAPGITGLPLSAPGMKIGLFGGSFNPPHEGHRLVAHESLKRIGLDAVWWLVTPGNPLKDTRTLAPIGERVAAARRLTNDPKIKITGFEAQYGFRYTYETLRFLKTRLPDRHFVWIMGADSLAGFHRWERWEEIFTLMPIAVYIRPGSTRTGPFSKAAQRFARYRIDEADARLLPTSRVPAWVFLNGMMSSLSSTQLRNGR